MKAEEQRAKEWLLKNTEYDKEDYDVFDITELSKMFSQYAKVYHLEQMRDKNMSFTVGDKVMWRGMDLIVVEVGVGEVLVATSQNVDDDGYCDWWVEVEYLKDKEQ